MSLSKISTAEDMISRGIIELQKPQPFFAHLLMRLNIKPLPKEVKVPARTMAVDGKGNMYYEAEWIMKETDQATLTGVLCHEVLHVAFLHPLRIGGRHHELSNIAQDIVVNMMVLKSGLKLPKDVIPYDMANDSSTLEINKKKYTVKAVSTKSWEEVYAELLDALKNDKSPMPEGRMGFDSHMNGTGGDGDDPISGEERKQLEAKWQGALAEAAQYAKQQGKLPGGMDRYIDGLLKPQVLWRTLLLRYLRPHMSPVDWSYSRPNRKSQQLEVFLPVIRKENCEVEIIVDTSGSIAGKELQEFMTEIVSISKSYTHVKMWVSFVDATVHSRKELEDASITDIMRLQAKGGGGTSMEAGLDHIKKVNPSTPIVIVLTDACDSWKRRRTDYPFDVMWVINPTGISLAEAKRIIPYGQKIKMDVN